MKKLMIAAAAAAMIGGVEAATATYQFNAYLTTTTGWKEKGYTTEDYEYNYVQFGRHKDTQQIWFESERTVTVQNTQKTKSAIVKAWNYTSTEQAGKYVRTCKWNSGSTGGMGGFTYNVANVFPNLEWDNSGTFPKIKVKASAKQGDRYIITEAESAFLKAIAADFNQPSDGEWCCEFEYWLDKTTSVDETCYRVIGYEEINTQVQLDLASCCNPVTIQENDAAFVNTNGDDVIRFGSTRSDYLLIRFGQPKTEDAQQLEIYATVDNVQIVSAQRPTDDFEGYLAGQGWAERVIPEGSADAVLAPREFWGKIVGTLVAPICKDCCTPVAELPTAYGFTCLGNTKTDADDRTAAFGDFYLSLIEVK